MNKALLNAQIIFLKKIEKEKEKEKLQNYISIWTLHIWKELQANQFGWKE
jgi:hypothetical protein